jgi:hypothetical protein
MRQKTFYLGKAQKEEIMKMIKSMFVVFCLMVFAISTAQAAEKAYAKDGTWYVHDSIVKSITGFKANEPVYVACGEDERVAGGYPGNAWLMAADLQGVWKEYKLTPPASGGEFWTIKVPAALKGIDTVRFNVAQASAPGQVRWAQIHLFRADMPYTARQDSNGKWHNGILLPTK